MLNEALVQAQEIKQVGNPINGKQAPLHLCVNDFNYHNVGLLDTKQQRFAILDMSQACLAPLGADLRWSFQYAFRLGQDLGEIPSIAGLYHRILLENG